MVQVDLITGFLGAGKTTFLKKYLHYLKKCGQNVLIIENEFGPVSIDSKLLEDEDDCSIRDLSGMCMCCVGKQAFIRILQESEGKGYDRILVEPSGIYDVDEFFDVMSHVRVRDFCEIGCILTIADPSQTEQLSEEAKYLMFSQLLASGTVLISKTSLCTKEKISEYRIWLNELMKEKGCDRGVLAEICEKEWDELEDDDFEELMESGYSRFVHEQESFIHTEIFQSVVTILHCTTETELKKKVQHFFENHNFGNVFRVKGFAKTEEGTVYEVNCTGELISVVPAAESECLLVVIGQHLKEKEIQCHARE